MHTPYIWGIIKFDLEDWLTTLLLSTLVLRLTFSFLQMELSVMRCCAVIPCSGNICGAESSAYLLGISIGGQRISVCPFHQTCHDQGYELDISMKDPDQSSRKRGRDESSDSDPDEPLLTDKRSCPDLDPDLDPDDDDDLDDFDDEELAELEELLDDDDLSDLDDEELAELEKLLGDKPA